MYELLDKIDSPADIKGFSMEQLRQLCHEIREYMVECCAVNPGHLGSSLGAVELIVGLHYVYDAPSDKLIFDVSHQAYAHKILTGRREAFLKNRCADGISGFTRMEESPYDAFGAGHASTSISAAYGYAAAAQISNAGYKSVALIGDGSLSGGLAYEGLNNAGDSNADLLVVVNDNNMSIDDNIGAMHRYLLRLTTDPLYNSVKTKVWNTLGDNSIRRWLQKKVTVRKSNIVQPSGGDLFEAMGFRYFGPIDGNDIESVVSTLKRLKSLKGPRILHTITKKGKGYAPAEEQQTIWHAPGQFDPESGQRIKGPQGVSRYQDVFGTVLTELADRDSRIVGITPAMASGCGMTGFAHKYPDRFFDVGIAEEHAVTFSAGLAAAGLKPFCNIYSSFAQRAYDEWIHDVALQKLGVVLCLDRAGLVGEDGATHHGAYDMAAFRCIPDCIIAVPSDEIQLKNLMYSAAASDRPYIIRYPRGHAEGVMWKDAPFEEIAAGTGRLMRKGKGIAIVALGPAVNRACEAAEMLSTEHGIEATVWDARFLKPFDRAILDDINSGNYTDIITVEDGSLKGGLYSEIAEFTAEKGKNIRIHALGIPDSFIHQGTQSSQREMCGLTCDKICQKVLQVCK